MDEIIRGDTGILNVSITYKSTGLPFPLTGYKVACTAKHDNVKIEKDSDASPTEIEITDETNGKVSIEFFPQETKVLGVYDYDVEIRNDALNRKFTVKKDKFKIVDDITK